MIKKDWHIHTYYSDGTYSPSDVILWAKEKGLNEIAITDHDGVDGIEEALAKGSKEGIKVIPGIELSTMTDDKKGLHILGYYIDRKNYDLIRSCEDVKKSREERNKKYFKALEEEGYPLTIEDLTMRPNQGFVGKPIIARAMVKKGYIKSTSEAFEGIFNTEKMRKIKKKKISTQKAISLIKNAGGIPVLAHPGLIRHLGERDTEAFFEKAELLIGELAKLGIEGLECIYAKHSETEKMRFSNIAKKQGLIITEGSDFHGDSEETNSASMI